MPTEAERIERLEARLDAMGALVRNVLTTLLLRGLLTKPVIEQILNDAAAAFDGSRAGVGEELRSVREDLPRRLRAAMGPEPDEHDHDH